ncbi:MAG: nucleotidyltransferase domain-containing protein, partial [Candidatus Sumerlaeota bacterium]|nr:nucleotidyltransferase domain-containing protein [Candidatus Sumerlaeota bacterium]
NFMCPFCAAKGIPMVEGAVIKIIQQYLAVLSRSGINAHRAVLFGSFARGDATEWSDIDLVVIAPEFDAKKERPQIEQLWKMTRHADTRIEPIPCGEREWETDEARPILEIARREGIMIAA